MLFVLKEENFAIAYGDLFSLSKYIRWRINRIHESTSKSISVSFLNNISNKLVSFDAAYADILFMKQKQTLIFKKL